jgi:hypothetical protein
MGFTGNQGVQGSQGNQGATGVQGFTGTTFTLTPYSNAITVSGSAGGVASNTAQSQVPVASNILIQGFTASAPANSRGITDLFVTSASPNWDLNIGVALASGISSATYTIYYYGS